MTVIPPLAREAMQHARSGNLEEAIARATAAVTTSPDDPGLRLFIATLHLRKGQLTDALPHLRTACLLLPHDPVPRLELVRVLIGLGELDEANALLEETKLPAAEQLRLRASILRRRGEFGAAVSIYNEIVAADPHDFESWANLGQSLLGTAEPGFAADAFDQSLRLRPDQVSVRSKWAEARFLSGDGDEAIDEMKGKLESNPADVGVWLALAHLYDLLGRQEESLAASEEAALRVPKSPETLIALAEALERRNDLTRLSTIIDQLAASGARDDRLLVLRAQLAFRGGDYEGSLALAQSASSSGDAGTRAQLIAQSLDRLGDAKLAYRWFAEMNAEDAKSGAFTDEIAEQARVSLLEDRNILSEEWVASWQPVPPGAAAPIFLVGFPRSGTTLLDTFLMGHPALAVAEEEPMLAKVGEKIGSVDSLPNLRTDQVEKLRSIYFQEAARHVGDLQTRTLLDKNPFAMGSQAIIHRIFPLARIIFMERHPFDVVLSCFMTRFQPTGLGANFLTLTNTAFLYDEMMSLWERSVEVLKPNLHYVRYERLVDNPEGELRPLSRFLGLEWLPDLLDHMATARSRPFIKTPSYSQVTEPVNARPVGRWVRYRKEIEAVLPVLEPWVRKLGYEL